MSEHAKGSAVLIVNLDPAGPVKAIILREMSESCECGGVSWLCDIAGHGLYTVCASAIRRPN